MMTIDSGHASELVDCRAPFSIEQWDETPDPPTAATGAVATARVLMTKRYVGGDLDATSTGHVLTTQGPGGAAYVAQERVTGRLWGRAGSFVLEHGAIGGDGVDMVQRAQIVPGSGTGELAGITGTGTVAHELLSLNVTLPR